MYIRVHRIFHASPEFEDSLVFALKTNHPLQQAFAAGTVTILGKDITDFFFLEELVWSLCALLTIAGLEGWEGLCPIPDFLIAQKRRLGTETAPKNRIIE